VEKHNEPPWYWPFRSDDKNTALAAVKQQLNVLVFFLDSLGNRLQYLDASGIGAEELVNIENTLKGRNRDDLDRAVQTARKHQTNREWLDKTLEMETVAINLKDAFR
jgi:hypothetical protein